MLYWPRDFDGTAGQEHMTDDRIDRCHLTAHPPERGPRAGATLNAGCCCCCCCCLHSAGSVIGAAAASGKWYNWYKDEKEPSAGPIYWSVFGVALVIAVAWAFLDTRQYGEKLLIVALLLPFGQLGVSLVSLAIIGMFTHNENRAARLRSLGRITGFSVAGGFIGMVAIFAAAYALPLLGM